MIVIGIFALDVAILNFFPSHVSSPLSFRHLNSDGKLQTAHLQFTSPLNPRREDLPFPRLISQIKLHAYWRRFVHAKHGDVRDRPQTSLSTSPRSSDERPMDARELRACFFLSFSLFVIKSRNKPKGKHFEWEFNARNEFATKRP